MNPLLKVSCFAVPAGVLLYNIQKIPVIEFHYSIYVALLAGIVGFFLTYTLIPRLEVFLFRRGLKGKDLGRTGRPDADEEIPSAVGVIVGIILLALVIALQVFDHKTPEQLVKYNAALQSMCFMLLLGFIDDVVDLPWRFKLILPPIGSLPLLCSYTGETSIAIPKLLRGLFWLSSPSTHTPLGQIEPTLLSHILSFFGIDADSYAYVINLGLIYYVYMSLLSVFCTNAINIYAGINGLEVGQSIVIAVAILFTNIYQLQYESIEAIHPHLLSAMILICFIGVSLGLLYWNWYPARCFVGDTYCYFAGVTFAVVGISGHFSRTLLIYLLPQIINFLYSCPQLFKIYPCPRHRLPGVDKNGLRIPSTFEIPDPKHPGKVIVKDNMTLINFVLRITGPIREDTLTFILLVLQAVVCIIGFSIRQYLSDVFYN